MTSGALRWQLPTLRNIIDRDDLHVAPFREDGSTTGTPTWIWCVEVDGELYVRAYHGTRSTWYQAAMNQGAGRIAAADLLRDVAFEHVQQSELLDRIDEAYRVKYAGSPYLASMIASKSRAATARVRPRTSP
ncbi:DUF2255 family protein [Pseudoxanthomonas mexicana]|uniref:DUF2255 family protein n=1 Tax=Pseudoxanthomonas mexicana TaxID=128785 RepID=UPI001FD6C02D|nr:DUF2255 family protein [Pseudoxanthomonas mexicana]UOV05462.1 DUF2255 family protein [Pseudoxanthomonas mexicana]